MELIVNSERGNKGEENFMEVLNALSAGRMGGGGGSVRKICQHSQLRDGDAKAVLVPSARSEVEVQDRC
jgi:hypothetical protein